jgi:Cdc6-like AAA superfamily ATPase
MKTYNSQYTSNIVNIEKYNIHPKLSALFEGVDFTELRNTIFYGPDGIGKYSHVLNIIKRYSKSNLNYYKKVVISQTNKDEYFIKISDIHYEVDMSLLGCKSRSLWNDIYTQITEIIMSSPQKRGIILCKNFQEINPELLDVFYCYVNELRINIDIKFFFITNNISFILPNLLNQLEIIAIKRPSRQSYESLIKSFDKTSCNNLTNININEVSNLNDIITTKKYISRSNKIIDTIYDMITTFDDKKTSLFDLREALYNILLFQLDVYECFYSILERLFINKKISNSDIMNINIRLVEFSKLFNNNYRPIFHLERFTLYLISVLHTNEP